jgi:uncharacterized lipoprotein YddW (UPF0748 family)
MSKKHEIIFETDGRHSSVYLYEPPMGIRQYVEPIDEVLDLGVDTISYVVGDCAVLLYDTKVGEIWGHNYDLINHEVWYKAAFNCQMMIESGHDPLQVVCDHAHERGLNFLAHLLLNMAYTPPSRVTNGRVATYNTLHPEWIVGEEPDYPEAVHDNPNRMSYAVPEIRENRLAIVRELVTDYPTDGIDLNFNIYMPLIARREVEEHTETITEWMRDVRRAADAAAEAQGRSKRVVVRMAATVEGNKKMGQDIETWVGEGLVDTIVAMPVGGDFSSETARLRELVEVAEGNGVPVIAGMDAVGTDQTRLTHRASTVNAYDAGVRGVMYHRYYPPPHRYPYNTEDTDRMRLAAYPDLLAHKDKTFYVGPGFDRRDAISFGLTDQLPHELTAGEQGPDITIDVSDDIAAKSEAGELWRCELRIMLHELVHHDEYRVYWNGEEVPESKIRKADWVFQMRPSAGVRGYRLHIDLRNVSLPIKGTNTVRVDLITKDEQLVDPVSIHDIDIVVEYLPHRNALRDEESYAGASIPFTP